MILHTLFHLQLGGVVRPNDGKCHIKQREDSTFFEYTLDTVFVSDGLVS